MKQFRTIFKFEYSNYARTKGFIIVTAILLVLIIALTCLPTIMGLIDGLTGKGNEDSGTQGGAQSGISANAQTPSKKAVIADPAGIYTVDVLAAYMPDYAWTKAANIDNAKAEIENEEYDLAVWIDGLNYRAYEKTESMMSMGSGSLISNMIRDVYQKGYLAERGLSPEEAAEALYAYPTGEVVTVGKDLSQSFWFSYVVLILMFMVMVLYSQFISTSVVIEKSSKAMEILITSAKPFQLMLGKVMGVGAAGLTQFGLLIATALVSFRLNYDGWVEFSPMVASILDMSISPELVSLALIFFLLGFLSFSFILAGFASTVSRMEEMQSVVILPMLLFVAAFYVSLIGSMMPTQSFVTVCSFVPFLSPLVMFMRICATDVPFYQILTAIAVNIVTVLGAAFVCSRIYRVGVMLYGKKPNIKDILRYVTKA